MDYSSFANKYQYVAISIKKHFVIFFNNINANNAVVSDCDLNVLRLTDIKSDNGNAIDITGLAYKRHLSISKPVPQNENLIARGSIYEHRGLLDWILRRPAKRYLDGYYFVEGDWTPVRYSICINSDWVIKTID